MNDSHGHPKPLHTPDDRYIVVKGQLWRATNPALPTEQKESLIQELMAARRAVKSAGTDTEKLRDARSRVHVAKVQLGERGPVWWEDGQPDFNRRKIENSPYADWYRELNSVSTDSQV